MTALRCCYTVKCFVQLVSQRFGNVVARQTYPATAKIVARQVARAESRTSSNQRLGSELYRICSVITEKWVV